eukprot:14103-Heterococcus_DN1.PRE.1
MVANTSYFQPVTCYSSNSVQLAQRNLVVVVMKVNLKAAVQHKHRWAAVHVCSSIIRDQQQQQQQQQ